MAELLRGAPVAKSMTEEVAERAALLAASGVTPKLAIVRVGDNPSDGAYVRGALKRAERAGVATELVSLPDTISQDELLGEISRINADRSIHGCLLLRPLPVHMDEPAVCAALAPEKDVDGITLGSLFGVFAGEETGFAPCTAEAVVELLERSGVEIAGSRVTVVGRSLVIGRPVAMLLMGKNATVTICHTKTRDLASECVRADILVVAAGHAATVGASAVRGGQVVVDVGINVDETGALPLCALSRPCREGLGRSPRPSS